MKAIILIPFLLLFLIPVNVNAPSVTHQPTIQPTTKIVSQNQTLNMTLLSASIVGCSQTANINSTWTGTGYYTVSPSSFALIIRTINAVYSNSSDVIFPNNIVQTWFLFRNIPVTLSISFISCNPIGSENLVFSDGTFFFILH